MEKIRYNKVGRRDAGRRESSLEQERYHKNYNNGGFNMPGDVTGITTIEDVAAREILDSRGNPRLRLKSY